MGICRDKFTRHMNDLGYNVVRHPREGIRPLDLIGKQKNSVRHLGRIDKLVRTPHGALPAIITDEQAADINGSSTASMRLAIGARLLSGVLAAQGGNPHVTAKYHSAKKLRFSFTNVLIDRVLPLDVSDLLRNGDVDEDDKILEQYVAGNGSLFVITRVAKSNRLTVSTETATGGALALDVPAIQGVVSGDIDVSADATSASTISYTGKKQLVFGFECFEIGVENGDLTITMARTGSVAMDAAAPADPLPTLLEFDNLLDLEDA